MDTLDHARVLTDTELDLVNGGAGRQASSTIATMLFNGVLDPWWELVGQTGHLPNPGE